MLWLAGRVHRAPGGGMNQWSSNWSRHSWCSGQGPPNMRLKSTVRVFILEATLVGSQGKAGGGGEGSGLWLGL